MTKEELCRIIVKKQKEIDNLQIKLFAQVLHDSIEEEYSNIPIRELKYNRGIEKQ